MIENRQPQQIHPEKMATKEKLLSNPAFVRFSSGFELYQELLNAEENENKRSAIIKRMHDIYAPKLNSVDEDIHQSAIKRELSQLIDLTLHECQEKHFSKDSFADKLSSSPIINIFLSEWDRQPTETEEGSGMIHVNEIIAYKKEYENEVSLHIRPTGVESVELISKIIDGFQMLGAKLEAGEIKADTITMKSWLLNKKMEQKAKILLGDGISIEDTTPDDADAIAAQHLALQYNKRSLEKYLKTGEKPEIRQIIMTKDEFVARFKKV